MGFLFNECYVSFKMKLIFNFLFPMFIITHSFIFSKEESISYSFEQNSGFFSYKNNRGNWHRNYKSFKEYSLKLNILNKNRMSSACLGFGRAKGTERYISNNREDIYSDNPTYFSFSYSYSLNDITKVPIFQKHANLNVFNYLNISPSFTYSMNRFTSGGGRIPYKRSASIGISFSFIKISFLIPFVRYEATTDIFGDRMSIGMFFYFDRLKENFYD